MAYHLKIVHPAGSKIFFYWVSFLDVVAVGKY